MPHTGSDPPYIPKARQHPMPDARHTPSPDGGLRLIRPALSASLPQISFALSLSFSEAVVRWRRRRCSVHGSPGRWWWRWRSAFISLSTLRLAQPTSACSRSIAPNVALEFRLIFYSNRKKRQAIFHAQNLLILCGSTHKDNPNKEAIFI